VGAFPSASPHKLAISFLFFRYVLFSRFILIKNQRRNRKILKKSAVLLLFLLFLIRPFLANQTGATVPFIAVFFLWTRKPMWDCLVAVLSKVSYIVGPFL
jgi:uncharacterized membrane protein